MNENLVVNEIFFSIQGESTHAGRPCAFIRLAGCDLRCSCCDTEYAFYHGTKMTLDEVVKKVAGFPTDLVEVTGGEPLLHPAVPALLSALVDSGKEVLLETGGHQDISNVSPQVTLVYDIKCPGSGMSERNRWENLPHLRSHDQIKFVLASRDDYEWAKTTIERYGLEKRIILFSPVWELLSPKDLAEWILEEGIQVRFQLQLQKILWGPEARGV